MRIRPRETWRGALRLHAGARRDQFSKTRNPEKVVYMYPCRKEARLSSSNQTCSSCVLLSHNLYCHRPNHWSVVDRRRFVSEHRCLVTSHYRAVAVKLESSVMTSSSSSSSSIVVVVRRRQATLGPLSSSVIVDVIIIISSNQTCSWRSRLNTATLVDVDQRGMLSAQTVDTIAPFFTTITAACHSQRATVRKYTCLRNN